MKTNNYKQTQIGETPEEWTIKTVETLIQEKALYPPIDGNHGELHPKSSDFVKKGIPFITAADIKDGQVDMTNCHFITSEQAQKLQKGFAQSGDVLLTHKATIGRTAIVPTTNNEFVVLTPQVTYYRILDKTKLHNGYLKYYFNSPSFQRLLKSWAGGGSTRDYIGILKQHELPILQPSLPEQQYIASILSSLDDKIELNLKMNKTLEEMGKALFKRWFVEFEFPNENNKPYKSSGGKMVDSELGEIPKEWRVQSLDEIAVFLNGLACQKYPPVDDEDAMPVIKIADLRGGFSANSDMASSKVDDNYHIYNGDVLFSWSGSLELCLWPYGDGILNQHLFKVTSDIFPKWFYYYWTLEHLPYFRSIASGKATTMGHIQRIHLTHAKVLVPNNQALELMSTIMQPLLEKIISNNQELALYKGLRDSLLPRLMSGKLRIN